MDKERNLTIRELAERIRQTNDSHEALRLSIQLREQTQRRAEDIRTQRRTPSRAEC